MFAAGRIAQFALLILFFVFTGLGIWLGRKGKKFEVRKLAALDALEEGVGRAAEMGRPVHFNPGWYSLDSVEAPQTVAALSVFDRLAHLCARYNVPVIVTLIRPDVIPVVDGLLRNAATAEGRPEIYKAENIRFLSPEQFAYFGGVAEIFAREKPATSVLMGGYMAYSLLVAELGYRYGAFQVAGTASWHQIPFFVAACDYSLIGEELFAAGAYLSKDATLLGGLFGQDVCKLTCVAYVVVATVLWLLGSDLFVKLLKI